MEMKAKIYKIIYYNYILIIAMFFILLKVAHAQSGSIELPSIAPTEVMISNSSSRYSVNFQISGNACSPPLHESLKPDHFGTYMCEGATVFNFTIVTDTGNGTNVRRAASLSPTGRYEIYSDPAGIWNIREVIAR